MANPGACSCYQEPVQAISLRHHGVNKIEAELKVSIVKALWNVMVQHWDCPKKLLSDRIATI